MPPTGSNGSELGGRSARVLRDRATSQPRLRAGGSPIRLRQGTPWRVLTPVAKEEDDNRPHGHVTLQDDAVEEGAVSVTMEAVDGIRFTLRDDRTWTTDSAHPWATRMVATLNEAFGPRMRAPSRYDTDPLQPQVQAVINVFGWTVVAEHPPPYRQRTDGEDGI